MRLEEMSPPEKRRNRKRLGRGNASGTGGTAGAGHKGAKSRAGHKRKIGFEGGQMPIQRRIPKRGFTNIFKQKYQVVNVGDLERAKGSSISIEVMIAAGLVKSPDKPVKVLGNGEVKEAYEVTANAFSKSAQEKIEKAGGKTLKL